MQIQVHGGDIYSKAYRLDFSTNINPFGMPESLKQAAIKGIDASIHYPDVQCRELINAISKKEEISSDWIICGNGAAESRSLYSCLRSNPERTEQNPPGHFRNYGFHTERQ